MYNGHFIENLREGIYVALNLHYFDLYFYLYDLKNEVKVKCNNFIW